MQSIGEVHGLQAPSGSPHSRPSIAGLSTTETLVQDDGDTLPAMSLVDATATKSFLSTGGGKSFFTWGLRGDSYIDGKNKANIWEFFMKKLFIKTCRNVCFLTEEAMFSSKKKFRWRSDSTPTNSTRG